MHSVTAILFDLGLPRFDTLLHNYRHYIILTVSSG